MRGIIGWHRALVKDRPAVGPMDPAWSGRQNGVIAPDPTGAAS